MTKKILLSAFACRPTAGSEWGVGWNFFHRISQFYDVHLITEGEFKDEVILASEKLGISKNKLHFVDLSQKARTRCHNQGDWRFYFDYRLWQKRAVNKAIKLHHEERFDLVHHLNMIGFREPGDMWKLNIPFVLGPLGGFGDIPQDFVKNQTLIQRIKNRIKATLNIASMRLPHVVRAFTSAKIILAAYPEALEKLQSNFSLEAILLPETGCDTVPQISTPRRNVIWVGKNVPRKQFELAATAFLNSDLSISERLIVVGKFSSEDMLKWKQYPNIIFMGELTRDEVLTQMAASRALLFTSVHEGNPHVVYEAVSVKTPVLCHDCYGMGQLINNKVGIKVPIKNTHFSMEAFKNALNELRAKNFSTEAMTKVSLDNSWDIRVTELINIYENCTINEKS